jgi:fucose permease
MGVLAHITESRQKLFLLITSCLAFISMGVSQAMYGPFYPVFRQTFDLGAAAVAVVTTMHFGGATAAIAASGFISRKLGAIPVAVGSAALLCVGYATIALSATWPVVVGGALVLGVGFGGLVSLNFLIARVFPVYASSVLSLLNALFSVGAMAGPLLASPFVEQGRYWPAFVIGGGVALLVMVLLAVQRIPAGKDADEGEQKGGVPKPVLGVAAFLMMYLFYIGAETSLGNWIPTHLTLQYDSGTASSLTSLFWVSLTAGRLVAVPVGARVRSSHIVPVVIGIGVLGVALAHVPGLAAVGYAIAGAAAGPVFPVGLAWIGERYPEHVGRVSSVVLSGGGIGAVAFPPVVGAVVDAAGIVSIPTSIGVILLMAGLSSLLIHLLARGEPRAAAPERSR